MKSSTLATIGGSAVAAVVLVWVTKNIIWIALVGAGIAAVVFLKKKD